MRLKRAFTLFASLTLLATVLSLSSVPAVWAEGPTRLYVPSDFDTILDALDAARQIPQPEEVEILVAPGVYLGSLVIDRPHTSLIGLSEPQHDANGFLTGFAAPVEIQNVDPVAQVIVLITASNVRVEGFAVNRIGGGGVFDGVIGAWGHEPGSEREEILEEIVIRNNLIEAGRGIAIAIQQANVEVLQNTSITDDPGDPDDRGQYGVIAQGGDSALGPTPHVKIAQNHFANKQVGVSLIASVFGFGESGRHTDPSSLGVEVRDNRIEQSGDNITAIFRGGASVSPSAEASLHLQVRGNLLGLPAGSDLSIHGGGQTAAEGAESGRMVIQWKGNEQEEGSTGEFTADISYAKFGDPNNGYVADSTILLIDTDRSFGDITEVAGNLDRGEGYRNTFTRRP